MLSSNPSRPTLTVVKAGGDALVRELLEWVPTAPAEVIFVFAALFVLVVRRPTAVTALALECDPPRFPAVGN